MVFRYSQFGLECVLFYDSSMLFLIRTFCCIYCNCKAVLSLQQLMLQFHLHRALILPSKYFGAQFFKFFGKNLVAYCASKWFFVFVYSFVIFHDEVVILASIWSILWFNFCSNIFVNLVISSKKD